MGLGTPGQNTCTAGTSDTAKQLLPMPVGTEQPHRPAPWRMSGEENPYPLAACTAER